MLNLNILNALQPQMWDDFKIENDLQVNTVDIFIENYKNTK